MSISLSRQFSFEAEGQQLVHLEASPRQAAPEATSALPAPCGTVHEWLRVEQVAVLEAYLHQLGTLSSGGADQLVAFPPNFPALVQEVVFDRQQLYAVGRGWLSTNTATSGTAPQGSSLDPPAASHTVQFSANGDPGVSEALHRVRQLDRELAAADQRAAAVVAAGKALEQRMQCGKAGDHFGDEAGYEADPPNGEAGNLAAAMACTRRRLQREAHLAAALQEGGAAGTAANGAAPSYAVSASGQQCGEADEALLETLLSHCPAAGEQEAATDVYNPYEQAAAALAAIDAQLASVLGSEPSSRGSGVQGATGVTATPTSINMASAPPRSSSESNGNSGKDELAGNREHYMRAQREKDIIDAALRALKTGRSIPAAANVACC